VYAECVALRLRRAGISFEAQVTVPVVSEVVTILLGFRADVVVENTVASKSKPSPPFSHESRLLTWLGTSHLRIGRSMNFHAPRLKDGLRRFILNEPQPLRGFPWSSRVLRGENHQPRRLHDAGSDPTTWTNARSARARVDGRLERATWRGNPLRLTMNPPAVGGRLETASWRGKLLALPISPVIDGKLGRPPGTASA
jgi:GxxExxY protein